MIEQAYRRGRLAAALVLLAVAFPAPAAAPRARAFETVPRRALTELKATVGKPFSAGLVFVNGKFIDPPYKVERFGTAIRINGIQVTDQIIPWSEFVKTQAGARAEKDEAPAAEQSGADGQPAAAGQPDAEEPEQAEPQDGDEAASDASGQVDLDDLFADTPPAPKKKAPARKPEGRAPAAPAAAPVAPAAPPAAFEGEFKPNDRTRAMIAKINKRRTDIEVCLRKGGSCFFGVRYPAVMVDKGTADVFLGAIPQVMKNNSAFESFASAARAKGIAFLSEAELRDLFRNRFDYIRLEGRAKALKNESQWADLLNTSR